MLELDSVWKFMECDVGMDGGGYLRLRAPGRTQAQRTHQLRACASDVAWIWLLHLSLAAPSTIPPHATRAPALHIILLFVLRTR